MSQPTKKRKKNHVSLFERKQLQHLCDGTVVCIDDGKSFPVHRILMAVASPFFRAAFTSEGSYEDSSICEVPGIKSEVLQKIIDFVVDGEIDLSDENISDMILAADSFQMTDLREECRDFILHHLSIANCSAIYATLLRLEDHADLGSRCHRLILTNFERFAKNNALGELPSYVLESFLQSDDINVTDEDAVREAVLSWAGLREWRLTEYTPRLLFHVRNSPSGRTRRQKLSNPAQYLCPRPIPAEKCHVVIDTYRRTCYVTYDDIIDFARPVADLPCYVMPDAVAGDSAGHVYVIQGERCWLLDLLRDRFVPVPDLPLRLNRYGTAVVDGSLYVVGGDILSHSGSTVIKMYDPVVGRWRGLHLTQYAVRGPVAVVKGKIYALGRKCLTLKTKKQVVTFECYDPACDLWELQPPMPSPCDEGEVFSAWSNEGVVFVASRRTREGVVEVSAYDTAREEWSEPVSYTFEEVVDPKISVVRSTPVLYEGDPNVKDPKAFVWNQSLNKWSKTNDQFLRNLRHCLVFCVDDSSILEELKHREAYEWKALLRA